MNRGRKISGGKYHSFRKRKSYEVTNQEKIVLLGETKRKSIRVLGGNKKTILLKDESANISFPGTNNVKKAQIKNVLETPQNKFLARQNRLMKSVIIETSLGKAKITNKPSREGSINAVLLDK
jgi:small subunit ribosomal protein S8e